MEYKVYILKSTIKERYHIGCSSDVNKRLDEHNKGKTKSTRPFRPWKLIYFECFSSKELAFKKEWHLKHPAGYLEKLEIIKKYGEVA
jgi:putative endonuclease